MSLPPLAPVPPARLRLDLGSDEWKACLDAWITLTDFYVRLLPKRFSAATASERSLVEFLTSFYHETARSEPGDSTLSAPNAQELKRICFKLVHRIYLETDPPAQLIDFDFVANFCHAHVKSVALIRLMNSLWKRQGKAMQDSMQKQKNLVLKMLELPAENGFVLILWQLATVMMASPDAALLFMTGTDFVDALAASYDASKAAEERKNVVAVAYSGLLSLVKIDHPNVSLLSDHLFSLKAQADQANNKSSLLPELVTNTPLISKLRRAASGTSTARLVETLNSIETYRSPSIVRPRKHVRRNPDKGKVKASQVDGELHIHRMSLATQVQDLFPDMGSGYVLKLLDEYDDNVEEVTAHLLDDSLPARLRGLDRSEQAAAYDSSTEARIDNLVPRSTPPPAEYFIPERRNAYDDDEVDRLEFDAARLHIGKKEYVQSEGHTNKAAILSALAAFDSDDDERDDTYDVEDVGGTVDTTSPDGEPGTSAKTTQEELDMTLFATYKSSPELFGGTFDIRKGQARQALKADTGMTDEAIEGWAIMLQRDPKRLKRLEALSSGFDGRQTELQRTSYRESPGGTETEDSDAPAGRGGFRGRSRGRGRGGRGRGGNVAGPSNDPNTANAQRGKEANKASRANHNRRDQRARKMARGGFAG